MSNQIKRFLWILFREVHSDASPGDRERTVRRTCIRSVPWLHDPEPTACRSRQPDTADTGSDRSIVHGTGAADVATVRPETATRCPGKGATLAGSYANAVDRRALSVHHEHVIGGEHQMSVPVRVFPVKPLRLALPGWG